MLHSIIFKVDNITEDKLIKQIANIYLGRFSPYNQSSLPSSFYHTSVIYYLLHCRIKHVKKIWIQMGQKNI